MMHVHGGVCCVVLCGADDAQLLFCLCPCRRCMWACVCVCVGRWVSSCCVYVCGVVRQARAVIKNACGTSHVPLEEEDDEKEEEDEDDDATCGKGTIFISSAKERKNQQSVERANAIGHSMFLCPRTTRSRVQRWHGQLKCKCWEGARREAQIRLQMRDGVMDRGDAFPCQGRQTARASFDSVRLTVFTFLLSLFVCWFRCFFYRATVESGAFCVLSFLSHFKRTNSRFFNAVLCVYLCIC